MNTFVFRLGRDALARGSLCVASRALALVFSLVVAAACLCLSAPTTPAYATDAAIAGQATVVSVSSSVSMFVDDQGALWMCGRTSEFPIAGDFATNVDAYGSSIADVPVKVMDGVASVSCGTNHYAILKKDRTLWMWGSNNYGQVGCGHEGNERVSDPYGDGFRVPRAVCVLDDVVAVSCGDLTTAAVRSDGSLWMWGQARDVGSGVAGDDVFDWGGHATAIQSHPICVEHDVVAVSCGGNYRAFIKSDSSLWAWSDHGFLYLGGGLASVCCGANHLLALDMNGGLWAYGLNVYGQLTLPVDEENGWSQVIGPLKIMDGVVWAGTTESSCFAVKTDGSVWTWGENESGSLGNGDQNLPSMATTHTQPQPGKILDGVAFACMGASIFPSGFVLMNDGSMKGWGDNRFGQLGDGYSGDMWWGIGGPGHDIVYAPSCSVPYDVKMGAMHVSWPRYLSGYEPSYTGFTDVHTGDWFEDFVAYVNDNGLMSGYSGTTRFGPYDALTRGMVATILYRYENPGSTATTTDAASQVNTSGFVDLPDGVWYTEAVNWAKREGIMTGDATTNYTTVRPNDPISRQELATMLYRFATELENADTTGASADSFASAPDADAVEDWAVEGVGWCFAKGVMTGDSKTKELSPRAFANRAAMAKMITVVTRDVLNG